MSPHFYMLLLVSYLVTAREVIGAHCVQVTQYIFIQLKSEIKVMPFLLTWDAEMQL